MRVTHNISSMHTQGALFSNNRQVAKDLEKLSTGLRVNRASDDAAGLAISEGLRSQVRGVEQAKKNALDGVSALNITEGALNEVHNIMQRQRELAIQSSTATYSNTERGYMEQEFQALNSEIDRIVASTNFNGIKLLSGTDFNGQKLWIDANSSNTVDAVTIGYNSAVSSVSGNVSSQDSAASAIATMDKEIQKVSSARASIGALVNRLETTINNLTVSVVNQQAAETQIRDVDFAYQSSSFTKNQILTQSAVAMLAQANASTQSVLSLIR
ncbi:MAG: flagellin [Chitinivibrionia bacterium]|nr:flagellin [Chitinivibrionia bacterium]